MEAQLKRWLMDPTIGKLVAVVIGLAVMYTIWRLLQRTVGHYVKDHKARYRARKLVTFVVYAGGALLLVTAFSDRLSGLTVAFGVAGAGIAFALRSPWHRPWPALWRRVDITFYPRR